MIITGTSVDARAYIEINSKISSMKKNFSTFLIAIAFCTLNFSCTEKGINDPSKRNSQWHWFIDKSTNKGEWIKIETSYSNNQRTGTYLGFYDSGTMREKGRITNGVLSDTVYYYDINEKLTKYVFLDSKGPISFYPINGPYKCYSGNGELVLEGLISNNQISNISGKGALAHFIQISDIINPVANEMSIIGQEFRNVFRGALKTKEAVSKNDIKKLDSLINLSKKQTEQATSALLQVSNFIEMTELKNTAIKTLNKHSSFLSNQYHEVLLLCEKKFTDEISEKMFNIFQSMINETNDELSFQKNLKEFQEIFLTENEMKLFLYERYRSHYDL